MRLIALLVTLLFSISVADANQQAVLRLHWQLLQNQAAQLDYEQKLQSVQLLASQIAVKPEHGTQLNLTPEQIFVTEKATSAELAFAKWQMLVALGAQAEDFRLVYTSSPQGQQHVWLAVDQGGVVQLLSDSQIISQSQFNKLLLSKQISVVSVADPNRILASRYSTRSTGNQIGDRVVL